MTRPTLSKGERTKAKIVQAAVRLVARHGFSDASFQMIADACGLSQSAVLYHFKSKSGLMEEIIGTITSHNHEMVSGLIEMTDNAGQRLLKHCRGNLMWAIEYRQDAQILILLYYLASFDEKFNRIFTRMIGTGRDRITAHLLSGEREGLFHLKKDPSEVAETLQDSLFGGMFYAAAAPKGVVQPGGLEEKYRRVIAAFTGWSGN